MLSARNSGELHVVGIVRISQGIQVLYQQKFAESSFIAGKVITSCWP